MRDTVLCHIFRLNSVSRPLSVVRCHLYLAIQMTTWLLRRALNSLQNTMVVMSMEGHDVFSKVTGGRPVFTSEAVGGGAPGPPKAGTGRGCLPPQRSCARSDQAGASEPKKRFHDPYIIRMQTT